MSFLRWRFQAQPWLILLLVPAIIAALAFWIKEARGPYWLGMNSDAEYIYLFGSLELVDLRVPHTTAHPGTPLQVLGALVIAGLHLLAGQGRVLNDVLLRPEFYLNAINATLRALCFMALWASGAAAFRWTRRLSWAVLLQLMPFFCAESLLDISRVGPEMVYLVLSPLYGVVLFLYVERQAPSEIRFATSFGILIGIGLATKLTAFPLLILSVFVLDTWRARLAAVASSAGAFLLGVLPIFFKLPELASYMMSLAMHKGLHGQGAVGLPDLTTYLAALWSLASNRWLFLFILCLISLGLVLSFWGEIRPDAVGRVARCRRVLAGFVLVSLLTLIIVAKHPALRYLLPLLELAGLGVILTLRLLIDTAILRTRRRAVVLGMLLGGVFLVEQVHLLHLLKQLQQNRDDQLAVVHAAETQFGKAVKVYYYRSSSLRHALYFGNGFAGFSFTSLLYRLYPDSYFYNVWGQGYSLWERRITLKEIRSRNPDVLLQGQTPSQELWPMPFALETVYERRIEGLYRPR